MNRTAFIFSLSAAYLSRILPRYWFGFFMLAAGTAIYQLWCAKRHEKPAKAALRDGIAEIYVLTVILMTCGTRLPDPHISMELIPFGSYVRLLSGGGLREAFQIGANILLFVPLGILIPRITGERGLWNTAKYALLFSFAIEFTQLITRVGCFETDDVIHNVLGAVIGFGIYSLCKGGKHHV